jgi:plastocyanin
MARISMLPAALVGSTIALSVIAVQPVSAQGAVTGQVSVLERPGETTTDLGNTVIYLVPTSSSRIRYKSDLKEQMAMQSRQFVPRVRVVTAGSTIEFPNQDPFSHNIFSNSPGASFDLGLYGRGMAKSTEFRKPGAYPVYCNIHSRMTGFIVVVATPWYTQAGADGRFSFGNVPAGTYTIHYWHERAPEQSREITVTASGLASVDAKLDARGFKFGKDYEASGSRY